MTMRVVLAEDSVLLREGLVRLLEEADATVLAAVGDGTALVAAVEEHQPEVAVVDVRMPPSFTDEGLRAALEIRRRFPSVGILVLSQYVEESYATDLLEAGGGSATCSRTASPSSPTCPTRSAGSPRAAPCWTRRSSPRCSPSAAGVTRWPSCPRASARCWSSWPRAAPTSRSDGSW